MTSTPLPESREEARPGGSKLESRFSPTLAPEPAWKDLPPLCAALLRDVIEHRVLSANAVAAFLRQVADHLPEFTAPEVLGSALVQAGLLTPYQLDRVLAGTAYGLILGNYRVLDRLGAGSMGVVFRAEHVLLKRQAAVKVLPVDDEFPAPVLERFYGEMHVLADLHHPNIVMAFDAGKLPSPGAGMPALHYLVMELVSGGDLEEYVLAKGPAPTARACAWACQAAAGLQEAHDHHLIHRDVKPSNLLLTQQRQVKLVDFGLARQFVSNLTDPRSLLGSIEFMAPEQSVDPSAVTGKADIYGLGATLFWLLTGATPFPQEKSIAQALRALQKEPPRRLRQLAPDAPVELEALLDHMLQRDPQRRPAYPLAVINALEKFTAPLAPAWEICDFDGPSRGHHVSTAVPSPAAKPWRVLIVEDDAVVRTLVRSALEPLGCLCGETGDGESGLAQAQSEAYDLIVLDLGLPRLAGQEVCRRLRERPPRPHLKILVISAQGAPQQARDALALGADDFIAKPFDPQQLGAKVQHTLGLKDAQDRADQLARHLLLTNRQLEQSLQARANDVRQAQDALLFAMAKMAESREGESAGHGRRLQRYSLSLARHLQSEPLWSAIIDDVFLEQLERCVPLHDIGKIGIPDEILTKPGKLTPSERALVETHPLIGFGILDAIGRQYGESMAFMGMARAIVRSHHERFDGKGYPDRLAGEAIPPAARLVAVADVYDALRRKRCHKPALAHAEAAGWILDASDGSFDPAVLRAFAARQGEFERIYHEVRT